ncbi:hypothetical protein Salat_2095700 [Sesamum alatum]|uniref:Myb/SANT-like domain-containing protein n=1 Tax=Sesamum alatum TaxID=300844 RepID=A0AAE1Y0D8_9LAMI|nr:hypothetical protein Salat_2095700 [Sesamum alatum]
MSSEKANVVTVGVQMEKMHHLKLLGKAGGLRKILCFVYANVAKRLCLGHHGPRPTPGDISAAARGSYCGTFQWVDPPMCRRAKEVILGLLNLILRYGHKSSGRTNVWDERGWKQSNAERTNQTMVVFTQKVVNFALDWDHDLDFYETKLEQLRQRYHAFEAILRNPIFTWNVQTNIVRATKDEWASLVREAAPNEGQEGGTDDDDDDGVVFLGTSDGTKPHDVVDLVSSDGDA